MTIIAVISATSGLITNYIRYKNQNLDVKLFNFTHTGDIIVLFIFTAIILFSVINMFRKKSYKIGGLLFIMILSVLSPLILGFSFLFELKDIKLILYSVFLIFNVYILSVLILSAFNKSKKLPFIGAFGLSMMIFFIGAATTFYLVFNYTDDSNLYKSGKRKADAGVILGAAVWGGNRPSPVLRERINKGYEIYRDNFAPKLILTGGGSPNELTESEVSRKELIKYGVDPIDLIVETKSNSTNEQIQFVRDKYYRKFGYSRIIIVSDNFHLFRSSEMCRFNEMSVDCMASDTPLSAETNMNFCVKESFALIIFWMFGIG